MTRPKAEPPHPTLAQLGPLIRMLREQRGVGRGLFCASVGMTPSYLMSIESGRSLPGLNLLVRIAEALRVPVHELLILY
jgi:transcriptional regulator with XRE-family HTH domain